MVVFLGLYIALRQLNKSYAAIGTLLGIASMSEMWRTHQSGCDLLPELRGELERSCAAANASAVAGAVQAADQG